MKASELLVRCLENEGVRYIFGVPGEENLEFMEALSHSAQITFVTTRHEQGAAFMANVSGYELVEWAPQVWNSKSVSQKRLDDIPPIKDALVEHGLFLCVCR